MYNYCSESIGLKSQNFFFLCITIASRAYRLVQ